MFRRLFDAHGVARQRTETPARPWRVVRHLQVLLVRHALTVNRLCSSASEYLFFWYSWTHFLELNQDPCPDFWTRRRPRMAATRSALAVSPDFSSARLASGTSRAGPATAGMTKR